MNEKRKWHHLLSHGSHQPSLVLYVSTRHEETLVIHSYDATRYRQSRAPHVSRTFGSTCRWQRSL
jgi:hypothetical protein